MTPDGKFIVKIPLGLRGLNSSALAWLNDLNETAPKSEPWLNSDIRRLRQVRRKAKHKWKKDKLHI